MLCVKLMVFGWVLVFLACVEFLEIKVHEVDYCLHLSFDLMKDFGILETLNNFDWH